MLKKIMEIPKKEKQQKKENKQRMATALRVKVKTEVFLVFFKQYQKETLEQEYKHKVNITRHLTKKK